MYPSTSAVAVRRPAMSRALALVVTASILMATTMIAIAPSTVGATEPQSSCGVVPIDLVLILDRSGSMNTDEGSQDRIDWAQQAAVGLVNALDASTGATGDVGTLHRVGLTTFGGQTATSPILLSMAAPAAAVNTAINAIVASGGTPFDLGMSTGASNMTSGDRDFHAGVAVTQVFVFLSDGNPDPDSYAPTAGEVSAYLAAADTAYAVAIGADGGDLGGGGTGVDHDLMKLIAKPSPDNFRFVTQASGLPNLFAEIYQEIACPMGKLEVVKSLSPTSDAGRFDLWIGEALLADEAGHTGTTGEQTLQAGTYTVAETADGETSLANYTSSISCLNGQTPVTASGTAPTWSVDVTDGADIVCTIFNDRKSGKIEVVKDIEPNGDPGRFDLWIGAAILMDEAADGGTTGEQTVSTGSVAVAETADGETDLSDYDSSIGCVDTANQNAAVPATGTAPNWSVAVGHDSDIVCTITNTRGSGNLEVRKALSPTDDPGDFNLLIDGVIAGSGGNVGHGGTTGEQAVATGNHTVGEGASGDTELADYAGTISCLDGTAPVSASGSAPSWTVDVTNGSDIVCTITNSRRTGTIQVVKDLDPADDPGKFNLLIDGTSRLDDAGDEGATAVLTVNTGTHTVGESAGTETSLSDYASSISCWNGQSEVSATAGAGASWSVDVTDGANVVCTITNTRETGELTVIKNLEPSDDPGLFDLLIDGSVEATDAADGDGTGAVTVNTGTHTVGESAGTETSLGNYSSSIECLSGEGGEAERVASGLGAGPLDVEVTDGAEIVCTITNTRVTVGFGKASDVGDNAAVEPGETIGYTLTVHVNDGTATGVVVTDNLPEGLSYVPDSALPTAGFSVNGQELTWNVGELAEGQHEFTYDATVNADATGELMNLGCVDADQNHDFPIFDLFGDEGESGELVCEQTTVRVQNVSILKTNDASGPVVPGTVVDFTLTLSVINGPIDELTIVDQLPDGLGHVTLPSDGGSYNPVTNRITWNLADVADGMTLTYRAAASASATAGAYTNVATITDGPCVGEGCEDDSTVTVRVPTLTIVKSASTDIITISGPAGAPVASPSVVTWTLSYTLANGPVTGAVITDAIPTGFVFLDAANGGVNVDGTVTWNLGTLTSSGSVTFRTTVDAAAISRTAPTVNTAVIDSNETAPDEGSDSVTVTVEPPPLGGNPTPRPSLPNTAMANGINGETVTVPVELLVAAFLASFGALAFVNVQSSRRR